MILTCPECASRFSVDSARIGPAGRVVRCSSCNATWKAEAPEGMGEMAEAPLPLSISTPEAVAASHRDPPLPTKIRAKAVEKRKTREAMAAGVVWAGLAAGFAVVMLGAVLFRVDVVRLWPRTAGAYAFARMPVNPTGLALDGVKGEPGLSEGRASLRISGMERNVENRPRAATPLRVVLYDKAHQPLASQMVSEPAVNIAPGDARPFAAEFLDPPTASASFVVEFAFDAAHAPASKRTALPHSRLASSGPTALPPTPAVPRINPATVEDARPLPANSPYALSTPAAH